MKVDRTLQLRYFRKLWKENKGSKARYLWAFQYAKVRYALACKYARAKSRPGSQAPCFYKKEKKTAKMLMARFWQLAHSELESLCTELNKKFVLFEMATAQNFEQERYLQNAPSSVKLRVAPDGAQAGSWCSVDQPHGWHELASTSAQNASMSEDGETPNALLEESDEDMDEELSWREFNRRVSLFEEKMKAQRAHALAAFRKPLVDAS